MSLLDQRTGQDSSEAVEQQGGTAALGNGTAEAGLAAELSASVHGQEKAVQAVVRAVSIARARLVPVNRPLANLLFVGPTGVGKTQLVRSLARAVRTGEEDFCRVDMSSLAQEHYAASLAGAPPGYAGSKEGLSIFDRGKIESSPDMPGIVLFDEIEKAHITVVRSLLHVLDNGFLRLASGNETINFRNCIVVMTSNLGAGETSRFRKGRAFQLLHAAAERMAAVAPEAAVLQHRHRAWAGRREASILDRALENFFDPEFLNRVDEVIRFEGLDPDVGRAIVRDQVKEVSARLRRRYIGLVVDDSVIDYLARKGFSPQYGARALERTMRLELLAPLAARLSGVQASLAQPLQVRAALADGRIACRSRR
jgi:ATP-dependent Clp protease ATP-binding subunit ClpA